LCSHSPYVKNVKSFLSHKTYRGADHRFFSPQPDTSLHCKTMDTGLVHHHVVCLITSQLFILIIRYYFPNSQLVQPK